MGTDSWLKRSFATYEALDAYAQWLDRLDGATLDAAHYQEAWAVLAEADATYNTLLNLGSSDRFAWSALAPQSPPAVTIRRVGKALRAP